MNSSCTLRSTTRHLVRYWPLVLCSWSAIDTKSTRCNLLRTWYIFMWHKGIRYVNSGLPGSLLIVRWSSVKNPALERSHHGVRMTFRQVCRFVTTSNVSGKWARCENINISASSHKIYVYIYACTADSANSKFGKLDHCKYVASGLVPQERFSFITRRGISRLYRSCSFGEPHSYSIL